ncbi:MAG TPA: hypothetical protein VMV48_05355 [Gallionellaceae bacterium]|nr:hypothetical protein [Gallionellaceae bacterium]
MTKLLIIDAEARRVLGRLPLPRMQALQTSLNALCAAGWPKLRGPEPTTRLAKALWHIPPHCDDIFERLYAIADPALLQLLEHLTPAQSLALQVLTEIERGDAEGARSAFAAMRLFETPAAAAAHAHALLSASAGHAPEAALRHAHRPALWRAVVGLAVQTGRWDTKAVLESIRLVAQTQASPAGLTDEPDMQRILEMLRQLGVTFLGVEGDRLSYTVRGEEREPVRCKQLAEMLAEGSQTRGIARKTR